MASEVLKGKRILVVDDNGDCSTYAKDVLTFHAGSVVEVASSPSQALSLLENFDPDLILTDLHMPHPDDGIAFIARIVAMDWSALPKLVLWTAAGDFVPDDAEEFDHLDGHLTKASNVQSMMESLISELEEIIQKS